MKAVSPGAAAQEALVDGFSLKVATAAAILRLPPLPVVGVGSDAWLPSTIPPSKRAP